MDHTAEEYRAAYFGLVMLDPHLFRSHPVDPEWFLRTEDRKAVTILRDMDEAGEIDPVAFAQAMGSHGPRYLGMAHGDWVSVLSVEAAVAGLHRDHQRRVLLQIGRNLTVESMDTQELPEAIAAKTMGLLSELDTPTAGVDTVSAVLMEATTVLGRIVANGGHIGISTGFELLDRLICGWEPGKLYFVGARPKAGKTAFALQTAEAAARDGANVYFASKEMGKTQVGIRLISQHARIDATRLRRATINDAERARYANAVRRLKSLGDRLVFDTRTNVPWERIRAGILQHHARNPIGLLALDYIQMVRLSSKEDNRAGELERIAFGLKDLAKEIDAPVVALSQLNRGQDDDKPPSSNNHKGSGGIEQAADASILMWKPDKKNPQVVEFRVDLNRDGPTGKFRAQFTPEYTVFD